MVSPTRWTTPRRTTLRRRPAVYPCHLLTTRWAAATAVLADRTAAAAI